MRTPPVSGTRTPRWARAASGTRGILRSSGGARGACVEARLAGSRRSGPASEQQALRLLLEIAREALQAARRARELFGELINARQCLYRGVLRERRDRFAGFVDARHRAVDGVEVLREFPVRACDFGEQLIGMPERRARIAYERRGVLCNRPHRLGQLRQLPA